MKNAKNGASLGAIIGVAFAFMTTFFGGGWATGAQTGAYATQHGWTAIWAPLLGVAGQIGRALSDGLHSLENRQLYLISKLCHKHTFLSIIFHIALTRETSAGAAEPSPFLL